MSTRSADLLSLTKPRLSLLVILTAACGMALAPGSVPLWRWIVCVLGTSAVVAAANTLNCYLERDVDGFMERTADRPLVKGRLSPLSALVVGAVLIVSGSAALWIAANPLTMGLGILGFVLYIGLYTPMKRYSMLALFAGAAPGAIPPMMGWTAVTGHIDQGAWLLFGILFLWQLPHFIAISLFRQRDYDRAGLKTFPGTLGPRSAQTHMLIYVCFLLFVTFLPVSLGMAGVYYLGTALILGILFAGACAASFFRLKQLNWSRVVFFASLAYLPLVLGMWVLDQK